MAAGSGRRSCACPITLSRQMEDDRGANPVMRFGSVLGIETSCDETGAAVLGAEGRVLADAVLSQEREHAPYGGVVPEIAARAHLEHLLRMLRETMGSAGVGSGELAGVAASGGPGLIGGLIVGS